ncbi:MAG: hypothetical protein IJ708_09480, partial [Clostridia bacterium]|nr:hypothetical protein [Clostridia bacterium]
MQEISLGVRTLVEFTLHGEDIVQAYSLRAMQDGSLGHRARQKALKALGEGWESEVPLSETL